MSSIDVQSLNGHDDEEPNAGQLRKSNVVVEGRDSSTEGRIVDRSGSSFSFFFVSTTAAHCRKAIAYGQDGVVIIYRIVFGFEKCFTNRWNKQE
jgi:hypothetical protein